MRNLWSILLLALLLSGCNPIKDENRENSLRKVLWAYEQTLRWGEKRNAWGFQVDDLKITNPAPSNLDNIRVTGYSQIGNPVALEGDLTQVSARINYILNDRQVVREIMDHQLWRFNEDAEVWERVNPVPSF